MAVIHSSDHAQLHALVDAWRLHGDVDAAHHLRAALQRDVVQLCWRLGVLYAQEQAEQSIDAALYFTNPVASPRTWRRRSPGLREGEWEAGASTVFRGLCVHAILDSAGVATVDASNKSLPLAHRAALRLQIADVIDIDDAARWIGLEPDVVDDLWCSREIVIDVTIEPEGAASRARPLARRKVAIAAFASSMGSAGSALATMATAGAVAAAAVVIGIAGTSVAVQRGLVPGGAETPAVESGPDAVDGGGETVAPPGLGGQEGVEAPLAPGDLRPGLNVPNVDVPILDLEDLLGEDGVVDELVPVPVPDVSVPGVPAPDLPLPDGPVPDPGDLLPSESPAELPTPPDLVPTDAESLVDGLVEGVVGG